MIRNGMTALDIVSAQLDLALEAKESGTDYSISLADGIYRACRDRGLIDDAGRLRHRMAKNDLEHQCLFLIKRGWVHDPKTGRKILFSKRKRRHD